MSDYVDLLSVKSRVQIPFIKITMGGSTFGVYRKRISNSSANSYSNLSKTIVDYPNFVKSLRVKRNANGTVNTYTLEMAYAVTQFDDPNLLEKIFSKASKDREIIFSYGDYNAIDTSFRDEKALIQKIVPSFSSSSTTINYTITAVSSIMNKAVGLYNFPKIETKPSDKILELLYSTQYGLTEIFSGMIDRNKVLSKGLIARDDQTVTIDAKNQTSLLDYLNYLVTCMINVSDSSNESLKNSVYRLAFFDDISGEFSGPYFKVVRQHSVASKTNYNYLTYDLGYPESNPVLSFNANISEVWSILYNYNDQIDQSQIQYIINDEGITEPSYANKLVQSKNLYKVTETNKTWWSQMTSFPITANINLIGLVKPAILTTNIKVNILFYGNKYILTGVYMVIGQEDVIDSSGYRTTLNLIRVGGDQW